MYVVTSYVLNKRIFSTLNVVFYFWCYISIWHLRVSNYVRTSIFNDLYSTHIDSRSFDKLACKINVWLIICMKENFLLKRLLCELLTSLFHEFPIPNFREFLIQSGGFFSSKEMRLILGTIFILLQRKKNMCSIF